MCCFKTGVTRRYGNSQNELGVQYMNQSTTAINEQGKKLSTDWTVTCGVVITALRHYVIFTIYFENITTLVKLALHLFFHRLMG